MIRFFDIVFSLLALLVLSPLLVLVGLWISVESSGGVFFKQQRIGKHGVPFQLIKFRSMRQDAEARGQLTVGMRDPRITKSGYYIRKFKLDELPQLLNVLKGDMSLVGPRPEVKKYVDLYDEEQRAVLSVRPGITDYASIEYFKENELLAASKNPEETYIREIMPAKLELNRKFIDRPTFSNYVRVILLTVQKILK